jgi:hypothetical protein
MDHRLGCDAKRIRSIVVNAAPRVEVGTIICEPAAASAPDPGGSLASALAAVDHLVITVPVTIRAFPQQQERPELVVTTSLRALRGRREPTAHEPTPPADYLDRDVKMSGSVSFNAALASVQGGVDRSTTHHELVRDVAGAGSSSLRWVVRGGRRPLAAGQEFQFRVRRDEAAEAWVEATAELRVARRFHRQRPADSAADSRYAPLLSDSAPQAPTTLVLREGRSPHALRRLLVGRPLDLPLTLTAQGLSAARSRNDPGTIGIISWFDNAGGGPGYTWRQTSSAKVVHGASASEVLPHGSTTPLTNGSVLRFESGLCLYVDYAAPEFLGSVTLRFPLSLTLVVAGETVATYAASTDYLTVGRVQRDVNIDRSDISRSHGVFELTDAGWIYRHQSGSGEAGLIRGAAQVARIRAEESVRVGRGDTLRLNEDVSLVIG